MIRFTFFFLLLGTTSCLDFGDDLELTNEEITDKELAEVTRRTGIDFPQGKFVECALGKENGKWKLRHTVNLDGLDD